MMLTLTAIWDCVRLRTNAQAHPGLSATVPLARSFILSLGPQATSFKRVGPPIIHKLQAVNKIFYLTINLG